MKKQLTLITLVLWVLILWWCSDKVTNNVNADPKKQSEKSNLQTRTENTQLDSNIKKNTQSQWNYDTQTKAS